MKNYFDSMSAEEFDEYLKANEPPETMIQSEHYNHTIPKDKPVKKDKFKILKMEDIQIKEVDWLWYPYIPYGKITIIQGDPGEGKTTAILQIVGKLSRGESLPFDERERQPINTIYQTAEDGLSDTIKPRLVDAKADCNRIMVIDETEKSLTMLDERLEQAIIRTRARVLVLDPIQAYIGGNVNMNLANETRDVMKRLGILAEKYNCAIILIGHMNKGGGKSSYRGLGSIDFQAVARSVLIVGRVKDNPELRVIAHCKSSLAPEGDSIGFELNKITGFNFIGKVDLSVDDLLSGGSIDNKTYKAEKFLKEILADGSLAQSEIMEKSQELGLSKRLIDEVKKKLSIKSNKQQDKWYWSLP